MLEGGVKAGLPGVNPVTLPSRLLACVNSSITIDLSLFHCHGYWAKVVSTPKWKLDRAMLRGKSRTIMPSHVDK